MGKSNIEWCDVVWNPSTGCTKVSPGCAHCYAEKIDHRFRRDTNGEKLSWDIPASQGGRGVTLHPDRLDIPLKWRDPKMVFVNSMSDLFHEDVPDEFIEQVFAVMGLTPWHTFQVLTKRPERMAKWPFCGRFLKVALTESRDFPNHLGKAIKYVYGDDEEAIESGDFVGRWPLPNVWLGTSVENQHWADLRIPHLLDTPAAVRFLSMEPLLKPVVLSPYLRCQLCQEPPVPDAHYAEAGWNAPTREGIDWVIIGGESGPKARPMKIEWALDIIEQCRKTGVAVFFKQTGTVLAKELGLKKRAGGDFEDPNFPEELKVREFPQREG